MKSLARKWSLALLVLASLTHNSQADSTVVFNEIMYHPSETEADREWIEIHNQMAVDMDISSWRLTGGVEFQFPEGTTVQGGGYLVIARNPEAVRQLTGLERVVGPMQGRLSNGGERLELRNNNDRLMDSVVYGVSGDWPVAPDGFGVSLAKRDPQSASGPSINWQASLELDGTPGADNFPVAIAAAEVELIPAESLWRLEKDGAAVGSDWTMATFSDAAWTLTPTPIHGGEAPAPGGTVRAIPTLYGTGLASDRSVLVPGTRDPHYTVTLSAEKVTPAPPAPALVIDGHPAWAANSSDSQWLGPVQPGTANVAAGNYRYQTTFDLSGFVPETARLTLNLAADNRLNSVVLNGVSMGISFVGFSEMSPDFLLTSGFRSGTNTLEFRWANDGGGANPGGLRVQARGTARSVSAPDSKLSPVRLTTHLRKIFLVAGNPRGKGLRLRATIDDGAVFHLNGREIFRHNLPAGIITPQTPALSNLPGIPSVIERTFPAGLLVPGTNLLAVELHQASDGLTDAWFEAELWARDVAGTEGSQVVLNEIGGAGAGFFVELANRGTSPISLAGWQLLVEGKQTAHFDFAPSTLLGATSLLSMTVEELGFQPSPGDRIALFSPGKTFIADALVIDARAKARSPDYQGSWRVPASATPGATNQFQFATAIVINEIHYHPRTGDDRGTWIELFNRGPLDVDLSGWRLDRGVQFSFPPATRLESGKFLLVAENPSRLRQSHPTLQVAGPFTNRLSRSGELLRLVDAHGNPADQLRYFDSGRWPANADGGGSSLERVNPWADSDAAEAWGASQSTPIGWSNFTYRAVATNTRGPTLWNEFILGLLDRGECLLDDVQVKESPDSSPISLIQNGTFENGTRFWRFLGTHQLSKVIDDPDQPGNHVLHLIATGPTEHMHNHLETTFTGNRSIVVGRTYEVSFRARWLSGNAQLNTRLYFNRAARTTVLPSLVNGGTPGATNSASKPNLGPTFTRFTHSPTVPKANQSVEVTAQARSPVGIQSARLFWSVNGSAWNQKAASVLEDGTVKASVPPNSAGSVVQFYLTATDTTGSSNAFPSRGAASRAFYAVEDGRAQKGRMHQLRILMTPQDNALLHAETNVMSNEYLGCTVVYDERESFYDMGVHLQGSQRGRFDGGRVGFTLRFPPDQLFRGVHDSLSIDRSGGYTGVGGDQDEIILKHALQHAGGLPGMYDDLVRVMPMRSDLTGTGLMILAKYGDEFLDSQFENGSDGNLFKLELIYYPTTTIGTVQDLKRPQPDDIAAVDIGDIGNDPELYRWFYLQENNRSSNDYSQVIALAKAMSRTGTPFDTETQRLMDVDMWLRAFAFQSLWGQVDAYPLDNPHNFIIYFRPSDGRALPFLWDMDYNFGAAANSPLNRTTGNAAKLLAIPGNQRLFLGHFLDLITTTYNTNYLTRWIDHYGTVAGQNFSGIRSYVDQRVKSVRSQLPAKVPFALTTNNGQDFMVTTPSVSIAGRAWIDIKRIQLGQSLEQPAFRWTTSTAWQSQIPLQLGTNRLEFLGYDFQGKVIATNIVNVTSTATGGVRDTDGDGMPDGWETQFGFDPAALDGTADDDGDGMSNAEEFLAGTHPRDRESLLTLGARRVGDTTELHFRSAAGRTYSLLSRDSLTSGQWIHEADVPAQAMDGDAKVTPTNAPLKPTKYYRIVTPRL